MLENQRFRLLREDPWPDATALSQELYAMFTDTEPTQLPGVQLTPPPGVTPIQIDQPSSTDGTSPVFSVNRGDDTFTFSIGPSGISFGMNGVEQPIVAAAGSGAKGTGNVFPGQVISQIGGNFYNMECWPNGRSKAAVELVVEQLEGDPSFPHKVGRWALVCAEADGSFSMVIPVWG